MTEVDMDTYVLAVFGEEARLYGPKEFTDAKHLSDHLFHRCGADETSLVFNPGAVFGDVQIHPDPRLKGDPE